MRFASSSFAANITDMGESGKEVSLASTGGLSETSNIIRFFYVKDGKDQTVSLYINKNHKCKSSGLDSNAIPFAIGVEEPGSPNRVAAFSD
jgi:hypothetical protein